MKGIQDLKGEIASIKLEGINLVKAIFSGDIDIREVKVRASYELVQVDDPQPEPEEEDQAQQETGAAGRSFPGAQLVRARTHYPTPSTQRESQWSPESLSHSLQGLKRQIRSGWVCQQEERRMAGLVRAKSAE